MSQVPGRAVFKSLFRELHYCCVMPSSGVKARAYSPAFISWAIFGLAANFLPMPAAITVIGAAGVLHSAIAFISHGGQRLSAPGVFIYGTGLFAFFPAIHLTHNAQYGPTPVLEVAVNVIFFAQIISYYAIWKPVDLESPPLKPAAPAVRRWAMAMGCVLMGGGIFLNAINIQDQMISAATFTGLALYAVAAFRTPDRLTALPYLIVLAGFAGYATFIFEGFGRLVLGALGIVIAAAVAHRWKGRLVKIALVAIMPFVLSYMADERAEFAAQLSGTGQTKESGLESVVWPMLRFSQLIGLDRAGELVHGWGSTFFTSAVALFPRALWPEKPLGFGRELTYIFAPHLLETNHSEGALLFGEFLFNYGFLGLIVAVPVFAFSLNWFERKWVILNARPLDSRKAILGAVVLVILAAGTLDLLWMGTFTFMSRTGTRLLVVFALFVLMGWAQPKQKRLIPNLPPRQSELTLLPG